MWVPGHTGVQGNETADHLAAAGRRMGIWTDQVPEEDAKKWVDNTIKNAWLTEWLLRSRNNDQQLFLHRVKGDTSAWPDPPGHRDQVILSRLRTGHTRVSHNYSGNGPFRIQCETCNLPNSVEHFLLECPETEGPRRLYGLQGSVRDILQDDPARTAAPFLKDADLYDNL